MALVLAFLVKRPLYGVHLWLPKAHVEAPVCGRIALAGILLKLGSYGLCVVLPACGGPVVTLLLLLRAWGSVVCGAVSLRQPDLKRLVAYSSVVHMGAVGVGLSLGSELGRGGALLIVVGHGVCSPALFRYVYYIYQFTHSRLLCRCRGGRSAPLILAVLAVLVIVNMGVPPFLNLWREVCVFSALLPA